MKALRFTEETRKVSLVFFTFFFVYGLLHTPVIQFIVSLAVGAILEGITNSYEIALIGFLVMNYMFPIFYRKSVPDAYSNVTYAQFDSEEGFVDVSAVTGRITNMFKPTISGVGSPLTEGFADASDNDLTLTQSKKESDNSSDVTATTKPAELEKGGKNEQLAKMTEMMSSVMKNMGNNSEELANPKGSISKDAHASAAPKKISEQNVPAVTEPAESFTDNGGLFKLGQIPTESKGGFHIDAGTTVMNAINALKPDQIKAMTQDTKQLIDTQKSLMGMLQTFQPMVQEGKQMMDTFQSMFSPSMGAK